MLRCRSAWCGEGPTLLADLTGATSTSLGSSYRHPCPYLFDLLLFLFSIPRRTSLISSRCQFRNPPIASLSSTLFMDTITARISAVRRSPLTRTVSPGFNFRLILRLVFGLLAVGTIAMHVGFVICLLISVARPAHPLFNQRIELSASVPSHRPDIVN
jgi:hypothetical protein